MIGNSKAQPLPGQSIRVAIAEDVHLENRAIDAWVVVHRGEIVDDELVPTGGLDHEGAPTEGRRSIFGLKEALEVAHRARDKGISENAEVVAS